MRRTVSPLVVALVLLLLWPVPARAASRDRSKEVAAAQKRANAAAARLAAAQSAAARIERDVATLEKRITDARSRVDTLATRVRTLAVHQYVSGGASATPILADDPSALARSRTMLEIVTLGDADDLDRFRVAQDDLADNQEALRGSLADKREALSRLRADQRKAVKELDQLAAAQKAYEARKAAEARATRTRRASRSSGGATGVIATGSWVCPVQGPHSFSNDWHQPRSGGRLHQGNDILAPMGTPVVASVAGSVRGHHSRLGGISYYLHGDDGNVYFGTHLRSLATVSGHVAAGTVVGYVGNTGNASGGPAHLHFEIHPGGGGAVNPYPTLVKYC